MEKKKYIYILSGLNLCPSGGGVHFQCKDYYVGKEHKIRNLMVLFFILVLVFYVV